jgi:hypothetical protein
MNERWTSFGHGLRRSAIESNRRLNVRNGGFSDVTVESFGEQLVNEVK